jgi:hypothetical protein
MIDSNIYKARTEEAVSSTHGGQGAITTSSSRDDRRTANLALL